MNIKFKVIGVDEVIALMKTVPRGAKVAVMRALTEYIVGNESRGLRHEPAQVNHGPGNPYKWQSDRQRRAFFATDGFGQGIPTERTGETARSWTVKEQNSDWTRVSIENDSPGAHWVQGEGQQRGHKADGWRQYWDIVTTNLSGGVQAGLNALNAWLEGLGK